MLTQKDILKEFDEKFLTNPTKKIAYINGDEKRELSKFLSDKIKEVTESIKLKHKTFPERESDEFDAGYNTAIDQINDNIYKFFEV